MPFIFKVPPLPITVVFNGTGSIQTFIVPGSVNTISIKLWGGGGGSGTWDSTSDGGGGGFASGNLAISPSTILDIYVGMGGRGGSVRTGGWPNAGDGGNGSFSSGGGGGGLSAVFASGDFTTPYIIAGGGGGGGTEDGWVGGGLSGWWSTYAGSGQLGSQVAGGAGGDAASNPNLVVSASAGGFLNGGAGAGTGHGGGGGASGYYGGGGGAAGNVSGWGAQAGGGSSYIGHVNLSSTGTIFNPDGSNRFLAANEVDPNWATPAGRGGPGANNNGSDGRVVIQYFV